MEKRKRSIKKILLIVVIFAIIATFTACSKVQNNIEETTTDTITSSGITTTKTTTTEEETTETTEPITTTETTAKTTSATTTTKITTQKATTTTKSKETTTKKAVVTTTKKVTETTTEKAPDSEYNNLLSKLNSELSKKSFSDEINKLFMGVLENLYKNYTTWQKGYKDMPNTAEYIEEKLINVISDIDDTVFYERGTAKADELLSQGYAGAWTEETEDNKLVISIIATKAKNANQDTRNEDIEKFFHEIAHIYQKNIIFNNVYFNSNTSFKKIIVEGGATFHGKFTTPVKEELTSARIIKNADGSLRIEYQKNNGIGYLLELNAYEKLIYLAGYDTMEKVQKGTIPFSAIKEAIIQEYGQEQADRFLGTMEEWHSEYQNIYQSDKEYELGIKLENLFLEFMKQDISKLTKKQAKEYKPIYELYKSKVLSKVVETATQKDITNEVFNIAEIDKMLNAKSK